MRESVYLRCRDRNVGVEQIRQPNSVRFRGKAQQRTVGIKRIGAARLDELELHLLASDKVPSRRWLELGWRSLRVVQPK